MMMTEALKNKFNVIYESGSAGSYIVLKGQVCEKYQKYQVEMIAANPVDGILPLDVRQTNSTMGFYYNITSKQPLAQFLKRRRLTGIEFIAMLLSIIKVLLDVKNYLLKENLFLFDEDFIYINPNTLKASLVYMPIELECDYIQDFKTFLVKLVMFSLDIDESGNELLQKILIIVKKENFSIADLNSILLDFRPCGEFTKEKVQIPTEKRLTELNPKQFLKPLITHIQGEQKNRGENHEEQKMPHLIIPESKNDKKEKSENKNPEIQYKTSALSAAGVLQIITIIVLISVLKSGVLDTVGGNTTITYGAFVFVLGTVDFIIIRKLLDTKNKTIIKASKTAIELPLRDAEKLSNVKIAEELKTEAQSLQNKFVDKDLQKSFNDATELLGSVINKTTPLDELDEKIPYLQPESGEVEGRIAIDKSSFIIGRLKGHVDYLSINNAIGKLHAEFIIRDGVYYIKDLNSRNGTFVNDIRIDSNVEYEIKEQDRVSLANCRFIFSLS